MDPKSNQLTFLDINSLLAEGAFWTLNCSPMRRAIIHDSMQRASSEPDQNDLRAFRVPDPHGMLWVALSLGPETVAPPAERVDSRGNPIPVKRGTILHAALTAPREDRLQRGGVTDATSQRWEELCHQHEIAFLQWATDIDVDPALPVSLGMSTLGKLDYLGLDRASLHTVPLRPSAAVKLEPVSIEDSNSVLGFERLVANTYVNSLDCPPLENMLSPAEILAGYRSSNGYCPAWWFYVQPVAEVGSAGTSPIGCVILASHGESASPVVELVYMGVVPTHRGQGWGDAIVDAVIEVANAADASQLILAVDQQNNPAANIYRQRGMQTIFSEQVWGRRLSGGPQSTH